MVTNEAIELSLDTIALHFGHGECGAFAAAAYRRYAKNGWRPVVFNDQSGMPVHAACEVPSGGYFDAYGFCNHDEIQRRYHQLELTALPINAEHEGGGYDESVEAGLVAIFGFDDLDIEDAIETLNLLERLLVESKQAIVTGEAILPALMH